MQEDRGFHAKVSDFGLAVHMSQETTSSKLQGTEAYLPPQVYFDRELTQASDMYAFGLVLWEMLHGVLWCYVWEAEKRRRRCALSPAARPCVSTPPAVRCAVLSPSRSCLRRRSGVRAAGRGRNAWNTPLAAYAVGVL